MALYTQYPYLEHRHRTEFGSDVLKGYLQEYVQLNAARLLGKSLDLTEITRRGWSIKTAYGSFLWEKYYTPDVTTNWVMAREEKRYTDTRDYTLTMSLEDRAPLWLYISKRIAHDAHTAD